MNEPSPRASEDALDELVAEYIVLRERGSKDALQRLCAEHPDSAGELEERVAGLQRVQGALASLQLDSQAHQPHSWGRYTLEHELGRGGMGVVYLARDERLGRAVALKAMTAPILAGERGRKRFEREVQAVASLKHPGIVPVYEAGEENDVPYFTMEYIEGRTLAQALDELRGLGLHPAQLTGRHLGSATSADLGAGPERPAVPGPDSGYRATPQPSSRTSSKSYHELVCRILLDVAEALEHAHEHGVIHRDVKPSNVLLRPDGHAMLFDFGLARVEASRSMTLTRDFVGTPHYVSPEQVAGKGVDRRTDVYSLGVTLYELLTLCVPFEGASAQEVLARIPVREPTPVRTHNPAVPRDLETICHTAMAKDPAHRYPTAAEMAADLGRFLEYRPVVARPVGPWTRALRWTRRNPAPAAAAVLALLLVVGGPLAFGIVNKVARDRLAVEQRRTSRQRDRADRRAAEAEHERRVAQDALAVAELQRARGDRNIDRLLATIDAMLTRVAQDDLVHLPRMDRVRRELHERALALYRELLAEEGEDPAVRSQAARAQRRVGSILYELGQIDEAREAVARAIDLQDELDESSAPDLMERARAWTLRGLLEGAAGAQPSAEEAYRIALELRQRSADSMPGDEEILGSLAEAHLNLGNVHLDRGHQADAEREYRSALELCSDLLERSPEDPVRQENLASATLNLAAVLTDMGRLEEAESVGRESHELWRDLRDRHPDWYSARMGHVRASTNLADVLGDLGRTDEALPLLEESILVGTALAEERPDVPEYGEVLVAARTLAVGILVSAGDYEEAIAAADWALAGLAELEDRFPDLPVFHHRRVYVFDDLANAYQGLGRLSDEVATRRLAVRAREEIVAADPGHVPQHSRLGGALNNLARALHDSGQPELAAELLAEAVRHQRIAYGSDPENPQYRTFLRNHLWGLTETSLTAGDLVGAAEAARQMPALDRQGGEEHRRAAGFLSRCIAAARAGTEPPVSADQVSAWTEEALALLAVALERGGSNPDDLEGSPELEPLRAHAGFAGLLR